MHWIVDRKLNQTVAYNQIIYILLDVLIWEIVQYIWYVVDQSYLFYLFYLFYFGFGFGFQK